MGATVAGVVGRDEELQAARVALEGSASGVVVFRGEPGIGKTTVWEAATAAAAEFRRVLVVCPVEAERSLGLAALADLLEPVVDEVLPGLPPPQRHALEAALLRSTADSRAPEVRTLGAAFLGALRIVAGERGVLLAVDDLQWIDAASRAVLDFALRRLSTVPASAVLAVRAGDLNDRLPAFDRGSTISLVEIGPLSLGALQHVLANRLGTALPRRLSQRVHAASRGNPLYALEIARALRDHDATLPAGAELPLPSGLHELLRERLLALPPRTRRALAAAAALAEPGVELVEREGDLQPALDAGVVRVDRETVQFSHPLLASAAYALLAPRQQRELHRRLANLVSDLEQRARHLALAHPGPVEAVAVALEAAAERALARGAPLAAGELLELALQRTSDLRRLPALRVAAARAYHSAGDASAARPLAEQALAELPTGPERARALSLLSKLERDDLPAAVALAQRAWTEAEGDPVAEALAAMQLSFVGALAGDLPGAREFARLAPERADALPEPLLVAVIANAALIEIWATGRADPQLLERGVAVEERCGAPSEASGARLVLATQLFLEERHNEARALLEQLIANLEELGDEYRRQDALNHLAIVETRAGRPAIAAAMAARAAEIREQSGMPHGHAWFAFFAAQPAALLGNVEDARRLAESGLAASAAAGDVGAMLQNAAALGFLELSLGNPIAAVEVLAPAAERIARYAPGLHPAHAPLLPNLIEALLALGRFAEAERYLERLEERGRALDSAWALSQAARARGLLAAHEGDTATALARFEEALREHERMEGPFERGRTLLAQGSVLRRSRRRGAARESLSAAVAIFEQVEAPLWVEKARDELGRISGRRTASGLTPTEERIARLAVEGYSNKQIATELFVAVRTVETHLTAVYSKLGVHSRGELTRAIST